MEVGVETDQEELPESIEQVYTRRIQELQRGLALSSDLVSRLDQDLGRLDLETKSKDAKILELETKSESQTLALEHQVCSRIATS